MKTQIIDFPALSSGAYLVFPPIGSVDTQLYQSSSWYILSSGAKPSIVFLETSFDEGVTFNKLEGYEIAEADFGLDSWNQITCGLPLSHMRLAIHIGIVPPSSLKAVCVCEGSK